MRAIAGNSWGANKKLCSLSTEA